MDKIIFCIDLDQFFCRVCEIIDPTLRNTAFAVGTMNSNHGVISTSSYKAREYGVHSAMSLTEAYRLCPHLNVISINYDYYIHYHNLFLNTLKEFTPKISVASIDEVYMDVTDIPNINPLILANKIQNRLLKEHQLFASIGISHTLFLAKIASNINKPLGICYIKKDNVKQYIYNLNIKDINGIGKKTYEILKKYNIKTVKDFCSDLNKDILINEFGKNFYTDIIQKINGESSSTVQVEEDEYKSISQGHTYERKISQSDDFIIELDKLLKSLEIRFKKYSYFTKTITLQIKDINYKTISKSKTIKYTNDFTTIKNILLDIYYDNFLNITIKHITIHLGNLITKNEYINYNYNLFNIPAEINKELIVKEVIKSINKKYNKKVINQFKDIK